MGWPETESSIYSTILHGTLRQSAEAVKVFAIEKVTRTNQRALPSPHAMSPHYWEHIASNANSQDQRKDPAALETSNTVGPTPNTCCSMHPRYFNSYYFRGNPAGQDMDSSLQPQNVAVIRLLLDAEFHAQLG